MFPTYEVGSLPKLNTRIKLLRGQALDGQDHCELENLSKRYSPEVQAIRTIAHESEGRKLTPEERSKVIDANAHLNIRIQEMSGLDHVYDGEARRIEMYRNVARQIDGFSSLPELLRSRGPDSWEAATCISPPRLKSPDKLPITDEFAYVKTHAKKHIKVPIDDPYMIAVMSDNRYYTAALADRFRSNPRQWRYEAKRALTLALAEHVILPQVKAVVSQGADWIQLDIPAATIDIEHIPIVVEGVNAVVKNIDDVKFSLHMCYPRRVSLTEKSGYELLFPHVLSLDERIDHFSLELANGDQYEEDLRPFREHAGERKFEIGLGVLDITLERQEKNRMETPKEVRERILRAADALGDASLIFVAPDCGLRQLSLERCISLYEVMAEGANLARNG